MVKEAEILQLIHLKIHALRMLPNYKPSIFEMDLNKIISEYYKEKCSECKERLEIIKNLPEKKEASILNKVGGLFK